MLLDYFKNITFSQPWFFALFVLVPVLLLWYIFKNNARQGAIIISDAGARGLSSWKTSMRHLPFVLRLLTLSCIILALARPQTKNELQQAEGEGVDIVLCIDVSGSMTAQDFQPNRLEAAKNVAADFVSRRTTDRIGVVIFAGESFTQCPITTDHAVLVNLLREIKMGMIEDGTAIGEGLATAVNRLKGSEAKSKVIILLTDGVNNRGLVAPVTAAEIAKTYGVRVYTIGVGTMGVAPYPVQTPYGVQYQDMPVEIDEGILRQIAQMTDGKYFRATDNAKLQQVYTEIDKLEKSRIDVRQFRIREEKYLIYAVIAFALIMLEIVLRNTLFKNLN